MKFLYGKGCTESILSANEKNKWTLFDLCLQGVRERTEYKLIDSLHMGYRWDPFYGRLIWSVLKSIRRLERSLRTRSWMGYGLGSSLTPYWEDSVYRVLSQGLFLQGDTCQVSIVDEWCEGVGTKRDRNKSGELFSFKERRDGDTESKTPVSGG